MKKIVLLITLFSNYSFAQLNVKNSYFLGSINTLSNCNQQNLVSEFYFFNNRYIKRIDSASNANTRAGFFEHIWDLKEKKLYIINRSYAKIYVQDFEILNSPSLNPHSYLLRNTNKNEWERGDSTFFWYADRPDTLIHISKINQGDTLICIPMVSQSNLFSRYVGQDIGFIPQKITDTYKRQNQIQGDSCITAIVGIRYKKISNKFFALPKGYEIKPYIQSEIREIINKIMQSNVDFYQKVLEMLRERGYFQ